MLQRYRSRLSGPLLDRIDLHIEVPRVPHKDLTDQSPAEDSATIRQRVNQARTIQRDRLTPLRPARQQPDAGAAYPPLLQTG